MSVEWNVRSKTEAGGRAPIEIRELQDTAALRAAQALEKEVWDSSDRDLVPVVLLIAEREVGAILLGAYEGDVMAGFCYGFPGREHGESVIHSHVLGVKKEFRDRNIGYLLKAYQRERALQTGFPFITWTFDPLQSRNAFLNLEKLGAAATSYKIDFYGHGMDSPLHAGGTDRLWIVWDLDSERVRRRMESGADPVAFPDVEPLVSVGTSGEPLRGAIPDWASAQHALIGIPNSIDAIRAAEPSLAVRWREDTRWAFTTAFEAGMRVTGFQNGFYVLSRFLR